MSLYDEGKAKNVDPNVAERYLNTHTLYTSRMVNTVSHVRHALEQTLLDLVHDTHV